MAWSVAVAPPEKPAKATGVDASLAPRLALGGPDAVQGGAALLLAGVVGELLFLVVGDDDGEPGGHVLTYNCWRHHRVDRGHPRPQVVRRVALRPEAVVGVLVGHDAASRPGPRLPR